MDDDDRVEEVPLATLDLAWEDVRDQLRAWREDNVRHAEEVIDMWSYCLEQNKHHLGDERWMIEEQVVLAGYDCNRLDVAEPCLISLSQRFPGSVRVMRLKAMRLEAQEKFVEAVDVYDSILRQDETNATARKRKVAILRAQGRIVEAIKELTEYLKIYMADSEAWHELADLYLKQGDHAKAAFCMEELLLSNPHNHLIYTRYAEIRYTQGGLENLELARTYFGQAAKLNPASVRALYGLFLSCTAIAGSAKCTVQKKKEAQRLASWALKELAEKYEALRRPTSGPGGSRGVGGALEGAKILETLEALCITDK